MGDFRDEVEAVLASMEELNARTEAWLNRRRAAGKPIRASTVEALAWVNESAAKLRDLIERPEDDL